jgi:transposase
MTIPHRANERHGRKGPFDREVYRQRNRVERLVNRLKQVRRVATRYEKRGTNYRAFLTVAAILIWL